MLTHAQIQRLQGLRQKKFRHQYREIFVEGEKLVVEAVRAGAEILQVFATPAWLDVYPPRPWLGDLPVMAVPEVQLEKVSGLETPPPVAAVVAMRPVRETLPDPAAGWVLALDQLSDPGNLGTLLRTADWFGITEVVCSNASVEAYNPKVVQASMGSVFRIQVTYTDLAPWLASLNVPRFAAVLDGEDYRSVEWPTAGVLVIGSESHGIRESVRAVCSHPVSIPARGAAESLNAAVAGGILLARVAAI